MNDEEASRGTSIESKIKSFYRRKDGRSTFQYFIRNHNGEVKNQEI